MNQIWANRLIAGTQTWENLPVQRQTVVKKLLLAAVSEGLISTDRYTEITGDPAQPQETEVGTE